MATVEAPSTPEQATEELKVRVKRTALQVIGAFVLVSGPLALAEIQSDGLTGADWQTITISGVTAAVVWVITAAMNYFKPVQTNP